MGFWEECTEVKYHSYHSRGCGYPHEITGDVNLALLGKVAFAKFLFYKVTFSLFPTLCFKSGSLSIAHSLGGGIVELNSTS